MSEIAEAALRYAKLGLAVIPLVPHGKKPMFKEWQKIASTDEKLVSRWWVQNPESNLGIATGPNSNCFVIDIDPQHGGRETLDSLLLKHGPLPRTWQQVTGGPYGGFQIFFRYPNVRVGNKQGWTPYPGMDVRGDGGFVVAPPSIHPDTGNPYCWDGANEIEDEPLADAPLWLLDLVKDGAHEHLQPHSNVDPVPDRIPGGTRHKTLVALAGRMRRMGLVAPEILPTLREFNRRCEPEKPDSALVQIAESMMMYQPGDMNLAKTANALWRVTKAREMEHESAKQAEAAELEKFEVKVVDGLEVHRTPQTELNCVIDGLLFYGLTIFAGTPKSGKSWAALQMALAVANGTRFLGALDVLRPGLVLYVALEENEARTGSRMRKLQPEETVYLQNIRMVYSMLPLLAGGKEQLEALLAQLKPSLVIIDTFTACVGDAGGKGRNVFRSEYAEVNTLHKLAETHQTAMVVIHHKRKTQPGASSGLDSVAGSAGFTAAADSIWTIDKEDTGVSSISITGRDVEDQTLAVKFDTGEPFGWSWMGSGDAVKSMKAEREICTALREEGAQSVGKLAMLLRQNVNQTRDMLYSLRERGYVQRDSGNKYFLLPQNQWPDWQGNQERDK